MLKSSTCILTSLLRKTVPKCLPARLVGTDIIQPINSPDSSLRDDSDFSLASNHPSSPIVIPCRPEHPNKFVAPRQAWLTNLDTVEEKKLGLVELHPSIFAVMPRIDLIHRNLYWQESIHFIDFKSDKSRADMKGGGRKPWPQKGTGRARHGSIRSPIFKGGGKAHAKWGPKTKFFMLPFATRLAGLTNMLTCKLAQDDLVIVDSLEIPTDKTKFIEDVIQARKWGVSVLFVNHTDVMPRNITLATDNMEPVTLMPYYGLNVYSMLKYDTLVITQKALSKIEERLLFNLNRADLFHEPFHRHKFNQSVMYYNS